MGDEAETRPPAAQNGASRRDISADRQRERKIQSVVKFRVSRLEIMRHITTRGVKS